MLEVLVGDLNRHMQDSPYIFTDKSWDVLICASDMTSVLAKGMVSDTHLLVTQSGTASHFLLVRQGYIDLVLRGTIGYTNCDLNVSNVNLQEGDTLTIDNFSFIYDGQMISPKQNPEASIPDFLKYPKLSDSEVLYW